MKNHTLIAGITGSGKTYTMHAVVDKCGRDAEYIILDTKRIEWPEYEEQAKKYAYRMEDVMDTLDYAISEMEARFDVMRARKEKLWPGKTLYVIIDEIADLMGTPNKKVYAQMIGKIAMLGRAAKVLLIAGTQIATQDVIPATIKNNMANIVAYRQGAGTAAKKKYNYLLGFQPETMPEYGVGYLITPANDRPLRKTTEEIVEILTNQ